MSDKRDDVEIIAKETVFQGYFRMDRYTLRHRTFAGGWTGKVVRELFERGHAVAVLLYDPDRDRVALIEQFRVGALAADLPPWQIECVAGIIDKDESPEQVAMRECVEEAGVEPSDLIRVGHYLVSGGGTSETCALYAARVDSTKVEGLHGLEQEDEDIRVFTLPADEAYDMIKDGRIHNLMAVNALTWLMLERDYLKARWRG